jgi:transcriptional regulator with XRE-family HTH domain
MAAAGRPRAALVAGSLLRHYRVRLKLHQQDVAQRARLARSTVAALELGSRPLRPHQAEALARALELADDEREALLAFVDRSLGMRRRGPPYALDADQERAVADLYRAGWEAAAISGVLQVHPTTVREALDRQGVSRRSVVDRHAARDRAIVAAYRDGMPVARIAAVHEVALSEVYRVLERERVPRRRPHAGGRPPRRRECRLTTGG